MPRADSMTTTGLSISGTDTGVGKTAVSCALCAALLARGHRVIAFKPVITGLDDPGPHDHELLAALTGQARRARALATTGVAVVEGAGGILAPFTADLAQGDWMARVGLGLVVAARPGLGTINHTLLTLEAARARGLDVRAVVLTPWPGEPTVMERSNRETIAKLGGVDVATLGRVDPGSAEGLVAATAAWDVEGWLGR